VSYLIGRSTGVLNSVLYVLVVAVHVCIPTNIHHVLRTIDAMKLWWQKGSGSPRPIHVQHAAQRIQPQICLPATGSGRGAPRDWSSSLHRVDSCTGLMKNRGDNRVQISIQKRHKRQGGWGAVCLCIVRRSVRSTSTCGTQSLSDGRVLVLLLQCRLLVVVPQLGSCLFAVLHLGS
jgi:hypothetical protein